MNEPQLSAEMEKLFEATGVGAIPETNEYAAAMIYEAGEAHGAEKERERCVELCNKVAVLGTYELYGETLTAIDKIIGEIISGREALQGEK